MCNCNSQNNFVDLPHLKIYLIMAKYKAKLASGTTYSGDIKIKWATASQEELAYAYEDLKLHSLVEKISSTKTKNEKTKVSSKNKVNKSGTKEE
jgi:hypothetical protein